MAVCGTFALKLSTAFSQSLPSTLGLIAIHKWESHVVRWLSDVSSHSHRDLMLEHLSSHLVEHRVCVRFPRRTEDLSFELVCLERLCRLVRGNSRTRLAYERNCFVSGGFRAKMKCFLNSFTT